VLSRRRGKVVKDDMVDGTNLIQVTATIPQAESFGLAPELMKKSSGEVTAPELVFSHWEDLDEDPFWIPTTEEEKEDYGQNLQTGDSSTGHDNNALKYIRMVRSRKGLLVDSSKIVVAAEKQRTLSRKK
jgi:ribosome assembly protein 1